MTARDETLDRGRVVARPADRRLTRRVVVEIKRISGPSGDGARVTIQFQPSGDESGSRDILERMLTRLGL